MTTVGYGDFSPVTFQGKIIAVVLMFTGIALIGIVTATLARGSWIRSIWRRIGARTLGRRKWPRKPRKRLLRHQPIPKSTYCARKCVS